MTWKPVRVKKVSDLERIAKAERRVVRAAEKHVKWLLGFEEIDLSATEVLLLDAVVQFNRARKAKK